MSTSVPLVRVLRGAVEESVHRGSYVLVEGDRVVEAVGRADQVVLYRSTAKPFQAMVAVTSGAADRFGLEQAELAIAAGSHNASEAQLAVVRSLLRKAGVSEDLLVCGGHWSIDPARAQAQVIEHGLDLASLPAVWSNCSGTHAAALAAARARDLPLESYAERDHPVQREIHEIVAACAGLPPSEVQLETDGCDMPIAGLTLRAMARSLSSLGRPAGLPAPLAEAARRVGAAMSACPLMVGGEGRFDTDLMTFSRQRVLSKGGAEGVHGLALPDRGLGLAVKVDDGNDRGYRILVIEILRRLGALAEEAADRLAERHGRTVRTKAGVPVGRLEVIGPGAASDTTTSGSA